MFETAVPVRDAISLRRSGVFEEKVPAPALAGRSPARSTTSIQRLYQFSFFFFGGLTPAFRLRRAANDSARALPIQLK
jgi:hypothetical protein